MYDGIDPIVKKHYPRGIHERSTAPEPYDYVNPWSREWLSRKQDLARAQLTDAWDLKLDLGTLDVEGYGVNSGPLGALVLNIDSRGRLTCAIRSTTTERTP